MVPEAQTKQPSASAHDAPGRLSARTKLAGGALVVGVVAWLVVAGAQAFTGSGRGAGWSSVGSQLAWIPTIFSAAPRNIGTFFVVSGIVLALGLPGAALLRLFQVVWHDQFEHAVFALAVGLAGLVPTILVVGTYIGLSRIDVALTTFLYVAVPAVWILPAHFRKWTAAAPGSLSRLRTRIRDSCNWLDVLLVILILALLYFALLGALSPEIQFDARWYHLGSAAHYVEVGHFYNIVAATHDPAMGLNPYQEIAYTGFYALSGAHGAKAFAFLDAPLICAAIIAFARVHFRSTRIGLVAALAFLSVPIASWSAATASNDLPVALYTILAVHALLSWLKNPSQRWGYAYLCIAMAAFSCGVKAFGLLTLGLIFAIVVVTVLARPDLRTSASARRLGVACGVVVLVCAAWWIRIGLMTGNPIFPLAYKIFPSQYWNQYSAAAQNQMNRRISLTTLPVGLVQTLWSTVTNPAPYQVIVGPLFLVGIPLTLCLAVCTKGRPRASFLLLGLFMLGWWIGWYLGGFSTSRYLVDIAPLACLWMAMGVADALHTPRFGRALPVVCLVGLIATCVATTQPLTTLERGSVSPGVEGSIPYQWAYLYRGESEVDVQLRYVPMVQYLDAHLDPRTTKVYDAAGLYAFYEYLGPEMYDGTTYGSPGTMRQWSLNDGDALQHLVANHVTHVVVPVAEVSSLEKSALWPHLVEVHRSPDGLVLYQIRTHTTH